jgi:hypothetical protein
MHPKENSIAQGSDISLESFFLQAAAQLSDNRSLTRLDSEKA